MTIKHKICAVLTHNINTKIELSFQTKAKRVRYVVGVNLWHNSDVRGWVNVIDWLRKNILAYLETIVNDSWGWAHITELNASNLIE